MEFELQNEKIDRLERELRDLSSSGSKDDVEVSDAEKNSEIVSIIILFWMFIMSRDKIE